MLNLVRKYFEEAPLFFGKLIHNCLATWYLYKNSQRTMMCIDEMEDGIEKVKAYAMIDGYICYYSHEDNFEVESIEQEFMCDINHDKFVLAGKKDGTVIDKGSGERFLFEHKTASNITSDYVGRLWSDMQIKIYCAYPQQEQFDGVIYNILQKWNAKPRKNEDLGAYQKRLTEQYASGSLFRREMLFFSDRDLQETRQYVYDVADTIASTEKYLRNPNSCFTIYGRKCPYYQLCSSGESPVVRDNFYEICEPHEELREELPF